jgi:hypothetical protein
MRKVEGLEGTQVYGQTGGVSEGLFVVAEDSTALEAVNELAAALGGICGCAHE